MQSNLYIPKKIHVGFQLREDTFTGKLAYIIYEDEKGVLRKKDSWEGWRNNTIQELILDNQPARFVFNKGVKRHGHFGSGRSVMRVYDTRDFEFEISIDNLVGILMHSDISKRDITEECVFAWAGKDLVLLPVNSDEYRTSVEYTDKQALKIGTKDLVKGYLYEKKKSDEVLMYMGFYDFFDNPHYGTIHKNYGKKHIFYNLESQEFVTPTMGTLAQVKVEEVQSNFPEIDTKLHDSIHLQELKDVTVRYNKKKEKELYSSQESLYKKIDGKIFRIIYSTYYSKEKIQPNHVWFSLAEFKKDGKDSALNFENITDQKYIENVLAEMGINWKYHKDNSSYYHQTSLKGTEYKKKDFLAKIVANGFGNEVIAITVLDDKQAVWS